MNYLVTKELLDLHDKYAGDLGLLDERWADKADQVRFSSNQIHALGEYIEKVRLLSSDAISRERRRHIEQRIDELEQLIAPDVVAALRERLC